MMTKRKDDIDDKNIPINLKWYKDIEKLFIFYKETKANTTFLQIFFKTALYCEIIIDAIMAGDPEKSRDEYEKDFYSALEGKFEFKNKKSAASIRKAISDAISCNIIAGKFCKILAVENLVEKGSDKLKSDNQAYMYKQETILTQYRKHRDFYIRFIADILEVMFKANLVSDMDTLNSNICKLMSNRPNTYDISDKYKNTAYHLYKLITTKADSRYYPNFSGEPDMLSRLTNEADPSIRQDSYEYLSVCEYFPVGTIERLGAMEMLSENKKNIYACQELYFFYQNNNVLYNMGGTKKFFIRRDIERAEEKYQKLSKKKANMLSANFRHNGTSSEYPIEQFYRQRMKYECGKLDEKEKKYIIDYLFSIHSDRSIPFNIDLVWFLKKSLDECTSEDQANIAHNINDLIMNNQWIENIMNSPSEESELQLTDIIFDLIHHKNIKNENLVINICCELTGSDVCKLKCFKEIAMNRTLYFQKLLMDSDENMKEELTSYKEDWNTVYDIIKKVINQIEEKKINC